MDNGLVLLSTPIQLQMHCIAIIHICVLVDGQWSDWLNGTCSVFCGVGMETRIRLCSNPYPSNGDKYCEGQAMDQVQCIKETCVITSKIILKLSFLDLLY